MLRLLGVTLTTVILLIALPVVLSGCRIGNRTSTKLSGYDLVSGYYATEPNSYTIAKKIGVNGSTQTQNTNIQNIPDALKNTFHNPMILQITDLDTGDAVMLNPTNTNLGFDIRVDTATKGISLSLIGEATVVGCKIEQTIIRTGSYNEQAATVNTFSTRGRVTLDYTTEYNWYGDASDCDPWLESAFYDCYMNSNQCTDFSYEFVRSVYDTFIQSGFMTTNEIKTARKVSYTARYR